MGTASPFMHRRTNFSSRLQSQGLPPGRWGGAGQNLDQPPPQATYGGMHDVKEPMIDPSDLGALNGRGILGLLIILPRAGIYRSDPFPLPSEER